MPPDTIEVIPRSQPRPPPRDVFAEAVVVDLPNKITSMITKRCDPAEEVNIKGEDGKPICLHVGFTNGDDACKIYGRKYGDATKPRLAFVVSEQDSVDKIYGNRTSRKSQYAYDDVDFLPEYQLGKKEDKISGIKKLLSSTMPAHLRKLCECLSIIRSNGFYADSKRQALSDKIVESTEKDKHQLDISESEDDSIDDDYPDNTPRKRKRSTVSEHEEVISYLKSGQVESIDDCDVFEDNDYTEDNPHKRKRSRTSKSS